MLKTRWIIPLLILAIGCQALILAIGCQALVFAPALHDVSAVFWGLSFALLVGALVLAVMRLRTERTIKRR